jgi:cytochrome c-type biogenesis protein CcmE
VFDGQEQISVKYQGILPNLFAEKKGVVVEGLYMNDGRFIANKVLAKHDENYMPPEVIKSLKETGKWQE